MPLSLLAAAWLLNPIQAANPGIKVTYRTTAARASKVLADLGKLAKMDLQPTAQTADEILVIQVKDIPISELMTRIALATSSVWRNENSVYRLTASTDVRRREEKDEEARRVEATRKAIEKRVAALKSIQESESKVAKGGLKSVTPDQIQAAMAGGSPENVAITKLLEGIDPAVLADLGPQGRIVFSTNPTQTQRALPGGATAIINDFIQKHNADAAGPIDESATGLSAEQLEAVKPFFKGRNTKIGEVAKALLVTSNMGFGVLNMTQLELRLYDAKGVSIYSGQDMLMPDSDLSALTQIAGTLTGKHDAAAPSKQTPIEYSEDSLEFQKATKGMMSGKYQIQFSPALKAKVFTPNAYDPLSFMASDELLSYAASKGKALVADVPDSAGGGLSAFLGGITKTVEEFAQKLETGDEMRVTADDTFVTIKPAYPSASRAGRLDRDALAALMQATEAKGMPSLDDLASYALKAPDPMQGGIGQLYLTLFVPGSMQQSLDGITDWEMLRFYGRLAPDARASLSRGGHFELGNLGSNQRASLEKMVYGSMSQLSVDDPQHPSDDKQPFWMKMIGGTQGGDYRSEPTEVVPNGIPGDGYYEVAVKTERFASPVTQGDGTNIGSIGVLGADELAIFKMFKEDKNYAQIAGMLPSFPQLRVGERQVLTFTFHLRPNVSLRETLRDHHMPQDAPIVSADNLPDDFKKQIDDQLAVFKKSPLGALGALMGGARGQVHP